MTCLPPFDNQVGLVLRVAKDGSWADVDWGGWAKRMLQTSLVVKTTIPFGDGTVTDLDREAELQ